MARDANIFLFGRRRCVESEQRLFPPFLGDVHALLKAPRVSVSLSSLGQHDCPHTGAFLGLVAANRAGCHVGSRK